MDSITSGLAKRLLAELLRDAERTDASYMVTHWPAGRRLCSRSEASDDVRVAAVREAVALLSASKASGTRVNRVLPNVLLELVRMQPGLAEMDLVQLLSIEADWYANRSFGINPHLVELTERLAAHQPLSAETRAALIKLRGRLVDYSPAKDARRLVKRLEPFLGSPEFPLDEREEWAAEMAADLRSMSADHRRSWLAWFAGRRTGASARGSLALLGHTAVRDQLGAWLSRIRAPSAPGGNNDFWVGPSPLMKDANARVLGAFVLEAAHVADSVVARALGNLAAVCFTKFPDLGAYSHRVGNACVRALGAMDCQDAVPELSRLASRLKYVVAKRLVESALQVAAKRSGTSVEDLQEDTVPTFGLAPDGVRRKALVDGVVELSVDGARVQIGWRDTRGRIHATVPSRVIRQHPDEIASLRKAAKDLERQLATQRTRLERLIGLERVMPIADWRRRYVDHPLLGHLGRALIWQFGEQTGIFLQGQILDAERRPLSPPPDVLVRLWHPVRGPREEVLAWRGFIEGERLTQLFAQAHRETYAATQEPAGTRQCRRFAGHYLREWVLARLCRERGWRYSLQVADPGGAATLALPGSGLQAKFSVAGMNEWNDQYESLMSGDVVFRDEKAHAVPLADVPAVALSEVLRDIDLFVTRSNVREAGEPDAPAARTRAYWQEWRWGALIGETDRHRAGTLELLLPTVDFGHHCSVSGSFLHVDAGGTQYQVHIGTGDVLVGNQVMNIDKAALRKLATVVWLPFRGDAVLADILTKARYLAQAASSRGGR